MSLNLATLQAIKRRLQEEPRENKHLILAVTYEINKRAEAAARMRSAYLAPFDVDESEEQER